MLVRRAGILRCASTYCCGPRGKVPKSLAYGLAQHYGSVVERFRFTPDSRPYRKLIDSSESCHLLPYAVQQRYHYSITSSASSSNDSEMVNPSA
jgi:hypothetical protein